MFDGCVCSRGCRSDFCPSVSCQMQRLPGQNFELLWKEHSNLGHTSGQLYEFAVDSLLLFLFLLMSNPTGQKTSHRP